MDRVRVRARVWVRVRVRVSANLLSPLLVVDWLITNPTPAYRPDTDSWFGFGFGLGLGLGLVIRVSAWGP